MFSKTHTLGRFAALLAVSCGATLANAEPPTTYSVSGVVVVKPEGGREWRYRRHLKPGGGGELRGAVVCLTAPGLAKSAPRAKPVEHALDQRDLQFVPQTLAIRAGDRVRFTNSDGHLHNVTIVDDLKVLNFSLHREDIHVESFERAGGLRRPHAATCNLHSQMQAWLCVFDHPWFAVTDAHGQFTLKDVPPGDYRVEALHAHTGEIAETRLSIPSTRESLDKPIKVELRLRGK